MYPQDGQDFQLGDLTLNLRTQDNPHDPLQALVEISLPDIEKEESQVFTVPTVSHKEDLIKMMVNSGNSARLLASKLKEWGYSARTT